MANSKPLFDPANGFTGIATGSDLIGARFVKIAGPKLDGKPVPIAYAGAADHPAGVLEADTLQNAAGGVLPVQVQLVECSAAISAVGPVELTANGRIQPLTSGRKCGIAWSLTTAAGQLALVQPIL